MSNPVKAKALVTGASSGIGAVYADRLAKRGYDLVLVARDTARLDALATRLRAETGVAIEVLTADLMDKGQLSAVEARLRQGDIGLLVNNAGGASSGGFTSGDLEPLYKLLDLNIGALTRLAGAAAQAFLDRGIEGAIVNIGSVLGFAPTYLPGTYGATKAYVLALSHALRAELGPRGIHVQAVLPAGTKTEIWQRNGMAARDEFMEAGELVDAALVGFDRREAVTIPPLADAGLYDAVEAAQQALMAGLDQSRAAARYRG